MMIDFFKEIVLSNLYWFSLPLIGYALLRIVKDVMSFPKPLKDIADVILKNHAFCVFVASFAITATLFSLISIFFYLFKLPVLLFALIYLIITVMSVAYLIWSRIKGKQVNGDPFELRGKSHYVRLITLLIFTVLGSNFVVNIHEGADIVRNGDAMYHLSRIKDIVANGFSIQCSFFHNLPEPAYHYNVIYSFFAVPAKLFSLEPFVIWRYSLGFFCLVGLLISFTFALFVFRKWLRAKEEPALSLALLSILSVMAFHSRWAYISNYPNRIVLIWATLLVICLSVRITKSNYKPVLIALISLALLITMTHPLYAMISTSLVILFMLTKLVIQKKDFISDKFSIVTYLLTVAVLMIGPVITKLMPVRLSDNLINVEEITNVPHYHISGMTILRPDIFSGDVKSWLLSFFGLIAIICLIYILRKRQHDLSLALSMIFFYAFFAFTPICTILNKFIPLWAIARFEDVGNIFVQLYFVIGLLCLLRISYRLIKKRCPKLIKRPNLKKIGYSLLFILITVTSAYFISNSPRVGVVDADIVYDGLSNLVNDEKRIFNKNKMVITPFGFILAPLFQIDILDVPYGHEVLTSDGGNRNSCMLHMIRSGFDYADLKAVGADYVMTISDNQAKNVLDKKTYLKLISSKEERFYYYVGKFYVYEFVELPGYDGGKVYQPCLDYQQNEKN